MEPDRSMTRAIFTRGRVVFSGTVGASRLIFKMRFWGSSAGSTDLSVSIRQVTWFGAALARDIPGTWVTIDMEMIKIAATVVVLGNLGFMAFSF